MKPDIAETSGRSEQQTLEKPASPPANEDLTIAEHLRAWKQSSSEGEDCYRNDSGDLIRVPGHSAQRFVEKYGALHPGHYHSRYERDWRKDFTALQQTR